MQIGTLLQQQPGAPCVLREVLVQLVHQVDGVEHTAELRAVLAPVTEPKYEEARRFAEDWLLRKDPTSPYREVARDELGKPTEERVPLSLPHEVLERERDRTFLLFALRDPDKPQQPLVPQAQYALLRKGLIRRQVNWLIEEYQRFISAQYPETLTPEQAAELAQDAEGKS